MVGYYTLQNIVRLVEIYCVFINALDYSGENKKVITTVQQLVFTGVFYALVISCSKDRPLLLTYKRRNLWPWKS